MLLLYDSYGVFFAAVLLMNKWKWTNSSCTSVNAYQHSLCFKPAVGHSKTTSMARNPTEILSCRNTAASVPKNLFSGINTPPKNSSLLYF